MKRILFVLMGGSLLASGLAWAGQPAAPAKSTQGLDAAFEKLKALAGEWQTEEAGTSIPGKNKVTYRVIGGGSAVMETLFPGSKMEMISVYHRDGDALVMTHYCAAGNQPRFKARLDATTGELVFDFAGGTNFDPKKDTHIHEGKILFVDANTISAEWILYAGGKAGGSHKMKLKRVK